MIQKKKKGISLVWTPVFPKEQELESRKYESEELAYDCIAKEGDSGYMK